jgi:hypothetical protein
MSVDNIRDYNQKMLAVLGTVVVIISIVGLFFTMKFVVTEISESFRDTGPDDGILSNERIEELQRESKREQLISYNSPTLVDSTDLIYMIPVSHKSLENAEMINQEVMGLFDLYEPKNYGAEVIDVRYSRQYYGDFNNLLIYDYKNQNVKKLFSKRVNFSDIQTEYFSDDILVLFKASTDDTNNDGIINQQDYRTLYIYSIKDQDLKEVKFENSDVLNIAFVEDSKNLIINFGVDHNENGSFEPNAEPSLIKRYNYDAGNLTDIVSQEMNDELQNTLEGSD